MKAPRRTTIVIAAQFALLLICLVFLAVVLFQNYCLKQEAKRYATTVGFVDARRSFALGNLWLYEIKQFKFDVDRSGPIPDDGAIDPTGRSEGKFKIYYYLVSQDFEPGHLEIQRAYVDAFNQHMHQFVDHPEWFDKDGNRVSSHGSNNQTNQTGASQN